MRPQRTSYSQYEPPVGVEAATEPGSRGRVLRNRLGIQRKRDMDQTEYQALLKAQESYLERITPRTQFTANLLQAMHREWLGDIYVWAGHYRTVELSKGEFQWPPAFRVGPNMETFERNALRTHTPCRPDLLQNVARRMAEVHAELLLIHPFRDGNGRLARWLADLMALQAGYPPPDYGFLGRGARSNRSRYLQGVQRGYLQDYTLLTEFFLEAVERRLVDFR